MHHIEIGPNDAGQRLDRFLRKLLPDCPVSVLNKWMRQNKIKCNRKKCPLSTYLKEGDKLDLYLPESVEVKEAPTAVVENEQLLPYPIILYQDKHILVAEKPTGVPTHSEISGAVNLRDMVLSHLIKMGAYSPEKEHTFVPAPANRLDRNTQGIVLFGISATGLRELTGMIRENQVEKYYICLAEGVFTNEKGKLIHQLYKDEKHQKAIISESGANTKEARLQYTVTKQYDSFAKVEILLQTGRFHQIRAQFSHIGHPILGDRKYGSNSSKYPYQALCSHRIVLHPPKNSALMYLADKSFHINPWFTNEISYK